MKKISTVRVNGNMIFKGHKLTIVWTSAIAGRATAFWMKRAKSFWNRNAHIRQHEFNRLKNCEMGCSLLKESTACERGGLERDSAWLESSAVSLQSLANPTTHPKLWHGPTGLLPRKQSLEERTIAIPRTVHQNVA
jgi:hypothetical protein